MWLSPRLPIDFYEFTVDSDPTLSTACMYLVVEDIGADFVP